MERCVGSSTRHGNNKGLRLNLSNWDNVLNSEVSSFQRLLSTQMQHLEQIMSCLWRCPQFKGVLIERGSTVYTHTFTGRFGGVANIP